MEISKGQDRNEVFLNKLQDSRLIPCLLLYLEDGQDNRQVHCLKRWAPYQLQHLKAEAIWTLAPLVSMLPQDFLSQNGPSLALYCVSTVANFQILQASMHLLHQLSKIPMLKLQLSRYCRSIASLKASCMVRFTAARNNTIGMEGASISRSDPLHSYFGFAQAVQKAMAEAKHLSTKEGSLEYVQSVFV